MRITLGELRSVIREEVARLTEMGAAPDRRGNLAALLAEVSSQEVELFVNSLADRLGFGSDSEQAIQWLQTWGGWTYGIRPDGRRTAPKPLRGNRGQFNNEALGHIAAALDAAGLQDINAAAMYVGTGGLETVVTEFLKKVSAM